MKTGKYSLSILTFLSAAGLLAGSCTRQDPEPPGEPIRFRVEEDCVTMTRTGSLRSEMIFQEGKDHVSLYETPYGGLTLGVKTRKARSGLSLSPVGGDLEIAYALDVDDQRIGENSFFIQVREPEGAAVRLL